MTIRTLRTSPRFVSVVPAIFVLTLSLFRPAMTAAAENRPAPSVSFRLLDGARLDLRSLCRRGPVLIDFWATWCKPCLQSLPEVRQLDEKFGPRGLTVIGVSIDGPRNFARVRPFITKLRLGYPVALDEDGSLQRDFKITAIPTAVLIDTAGVIQWVRSGYRPGEGSELAARIEALLGPPAEKTE